MVDATNETAKLIYIVIGYSMRYKNMIAFFFITPLIWQKD